MPIIETIIFEFENMMHLFSISLKKKTNYNSIHCNTIYKHTQICNMVHSLEICKTCIFEGVSLLSLGGFYVAKKHLGIYRHCVPLKFLLY